MTESEATAERSVIKLTELHPFNSITYVHRVCFVAFVFCFALVLCVCVCVCVFLRVGGGASR